MDFGKLDIARDSSQGATMDVINPETGDIAVDDNGNPFTITVMGADSPEFKRAVAKVRDANKSGRKLSRIEVERNAAKVLAQCTLGWSDNWMWDGEPFPFNYDNALKLYNKHAWLREAVDEFVGDRQAFIKRD